MASSGILVCMPYAFQPQIGRELMVPFVDARPCVTGCRHPQDVELPPPPPTQPPPVQPPPTQPPPTPTTCAFVAYLDAPAGTLFSQYTPEIGGPIAIVQQEPTIEHEGNDRVLRGPDNALWSGFYAPGLSDLETELDIEMSSNASAKANVRLRDSNAGDPTGINAIGITVTRDRLLIEDEGATLADDSFAITPGQRLKLTLQGDALDYALEDWAQNVLASGTVTVTSTVGTDFAINMQNPGDPKTHVFAPITICPPGVTAPVPPGPPTGGTTTQVTVEELLGSTGVGRVTQFGLLELRQSNEY